MIYKKYIKRAMDVTLSLGGTIAISPVMVGVAAAIKLDSKGPVFFKQKRVGINKSFFDILKFRSMSTQAPHDMPTHELGSGTNYITKVGQFIRKTSIDELPQLFNILKGDMSVVGPRPALWNQDDLVQERDKYGANDVKPGLTGWAQINGRDELPIEVKARFDGEYVEKESFLFDCRCFFGTFLSVLRGDGVVEGGTGSLNEKGETKKPKIMVITNHSYMLWQFRKELIENLHEKYEIILAMPDGDHGDDFRALGYKIYDTPLDRRGMNPLHDFELMKEYFSLIKSEKPEKVITYSIKPNVYGGFACTMLKTPYFVNVQGLGTAFQKRGLAEMVTLMYKLSLKKAEAVFFENDVNADEFLKRKIVVKDKLTVLNGAGVNLDYYDFKKYPENDATHFLFVGRIMKEKGIDEFLEAAKAIKKDYDTKVVFDVVGFFEDEYKEIISKMNSDETIVFHGFQKEVRPFYYSSDCVILPSYHEGMSNVLLEAASCGRPLITTDIPGCREAVEDEKSGYLCKVEDADDLTDKIRKFLNLSYNERETMGKAGRLRMEKYFDKKDVVEKTVGIIEN